jgi:hypothetical protein
MSRHDNQYLFRDVNAAQPEYKEQLVVIHSAAIFGGQYNIKMDFKQPVSLCGVLNFIKIGSQLKGFCVSGNEVPCLITTDKFHDHSVNSLARADGSMTVL